MITTRAMPALLPAHHRRVASQTTVKNDFAEALGSPLPLPGRPHWGFFVLRGRSLSVRHNSERAATRRVASGGF